MLVALAASAAGLVSATSVAQDPRPFQGQSMSTRATPAYTEPSERSKMNFTFPGVVAEVLVKEGDVVKAGDVLIGLDRRIEQTLLEALRLEAESTFKIDAARADLEQRKVELARKEKTLAGGGMNKSEVEEAELAVKLRQAQLDLEIEQAALKKLEAARQQIKIEMMQLAAPFDGIVERIDLREGEIAEESKPAVFVVRNDPLWVNANLPTAQAAALQVGDSLDVTYVDVGQTVSGKVIFLSPVADAASDTRRVKLEVPNPEGRPSGLNVSVSPPSGVAAR